MLRGYLVEDIIAKGVPYSNEIVAALNMMLSYSPRIFMMIGDEIKKFHTSSGGFAEMEHGWWLAYLLRRGNGQLPEYEYFDTYCLEYLASTKKIT